MASLPSSGGLNRRLQIRLLEQHDELLCLHRKACKKLGRGVIHDLRVSARQLIAGLELLEPIEAPVALEKTQHALKRLLHSLRDLRDVQVEEKQARKDGPGSLLKELKRRESPAEKRAIRGLRKYPRKRVRRDIRALAHYLDRSGAFTGSFEKELESMAARQVRQRFEQVLEALGKLPKKHPSALEIHEVRIRFKHFRYTWELLGRRVLSNMMEFQSMLGEIQDLHVMLATLSELARGKSYARAQARRQTELISRFTEKGPELLAPVRACFRQYRFGHGETSAPRRRMRASANSRKYRRKPAPRSRRREA